MKELFKDKQTTAAEYREMVQSTPDNHRLLYADGSKGQERTSWAWVHHFPGSEVTVRNETGHLNQAEVFDAEVVAIHKAVKWATVGTPVRTKVFSDNLAAVEKAASTDRLRAAREKHSKSTGFLRDDLTLPWSGALAIKGSPATNKQMRLLGVQPRQPPSRQLQPPSSGQRLGQRLGQRWPGSRRRQKPRRRRRSWRRGGVTTTLTRTRSLG